MTADQENFVQLILIERAVQDAKWGAVVKRRLPLTLWQTVLAEEVGEVSRAILHGPLDGRYPILQELVQVAAVALAMLEALETSPWGFDADKAG